MRLSDNVTFILFLLFLWLAGLSIVTVWPRLQPPASAWNAQQARCEDALERRRQLQSIWTTPFASGGEPRNVVFAVQYASANPYAEQWQSQSAAAQADIDTYCR